MDTALHALHALADQIRTAAAEGRPLRIVGGGTKDFYGQSLHGEVLEVRQPGAISDEGGDE